MNKRKHISIRIDDDILQKLHHVAKYEGRSLSGEIMFLINSCIRTFEKDNGAIELPDDSSNATTKK